MIGVLLAAAAFLHFEPGVHRRRQHPIEVHCDAGQPTVARTGVEGAPAATKSFVLIMDDPGRAMPNGFTHWVLADIPAATKDLPEASRSARSGIGEQWVPPAGLRGSMPATGAHHYHFQTDGARHRHGGRPAGCEPRGTSRRRWRDMCSQPPKRSGSIKSNLNSRWSFVVRRWSGLSAFNDSGLSAFND